MWWEFQKDKLRFRFLTDTIETREHRTVIAGGTIDYALTK